ncbi:hypothetical protein O6H91_15G036400 [Diphasiastrum complanatum]|nr:hypothetical protein O6H91_Y348600 [Diphasiastrum complanatum]KAJ7529172.1 hypothetical protein O6H91_15G036400 [Diphasiastrum complanatum]
MVKEVDSDGDGFIDLEEFVKLNRDASKEDELQAAFCVFDIDKNGLITPDELYRVLMGMGEKELSMEACYRMIKGVDCDGDGFVSYNEFQKMMMTNP